MFWGRLIVQWSVAFTRNFKVWLLPGGLPASTSSARRIYGELPIEYMHTGFVARVGSCRQGTLGTRAYTLDSPASVYHETLEQNVTDRT